MKNIILLAFYGIASSPSFPQEPTPIAGLPVAVNIGCHVTRHAEAEIQGVSSEQNSTRCRLQSAVFSLLTSYRTFHGIVTDVFGDGFAVPRRK